MTSWPADRLRDLQLRAACGYPARRSARARASSCKSGAGEVFHDLLDLRARRRGPHRGLYHYLDFAPKGRDEEGLAFYDGLVCRHHDRYDASYVLVQNGRTWRRRA